MTAFWDTSALVPLCVNEPRTATARSDWRRFREHFVWNETIVEIESSIARLLREEYLNQSSHQIALNQLAFIESNWIVVESTLRMTTLARTFPSIYGLRALDSLQLAAALIWCNEFPKNKNFVSADARLSKAAESAGFTVHLLG